MSVRVQILPATEAHALALAPNMRAADAAEVLGSGGYTPVGALLESVRCSVVAWTLFMDGEVAAMWGVSPVNLAAGIGAAWLLTGTAIDRHPKEFVRICRREVEKLLDVAPTLVNAIDARYEQALRWGLWLGFQFDDTPLYFNGLPFWRFTLTKEAFHACRNGARPHARGDEKGQGRRAAQEEGRDPEAGDGPLRVRHHAEGRDDEGREVSHV